jgi:hypothetical protein
VLVLRVSAGCPLRLTGAAVGRSRQQPRENRWASLPCQPRFGTKGRFF